MYEITNDRSLLTGRPSEAASVLLLERDGTAVAWITIDELETCPRHLLGSLPQTEMVVTDLVFEGHVPEERLVALVRQGLDDARSNTAEYVRYRVNPEFTAQAALARAAVERAGMQLFQEKEGLHLDPTGIGTDGVLEFRSLDDIGQEAFVPVIASIGRGTLDRNDRWFHERAGETNWAQVFLSMCAPEDRSSWMVAFDHTNDPVGFIGVSEMPIDEPTGWDITPCGTIVMVGVVPRHRGRGHIDEILSAGASAAARRGFAAMLDSVDVDNGPMLAAMARCGYRSDTRPWHDWHYRKPLSS